MMTYHAQKGRGYGHATVLICRDAACRVGLTARAELLVTSVLVYYVAITRLLLTMLLL